MPTLAGTSDKGQITRFASDVSRKITQDLIDHAHSDPGDPFSDSDHLDRRLARSLKTVGQIPTDHFIENYIGIIAEIMRRHKMLNLNGTNIEAPRQTPRKLAQKPKELK